MAALHLDYQRPPPGRQLPGIVLLAASLALCAALLQQSAGLARDTEIAEARLAEVRRAAAAARQSAASPAPAPPASASAARWEALFVALEGAADETVTLLALAPGERETVLTGEARDLPAALDYAQRLQAAPAFAGAHLAKYEVVREHPRQPVRFTVLAGGRESPP
ncbi:MAG TPA: hypothetical protein VF096_13445 [Azonexus sp.]